MSPVEATYTARMRLGVVLCAVIGHRWRIDETSTGPEPVMCCLRCGRRELPPEGSAFNRRIEAKTGADRAVGPFGGRR
jgi:hypothetical protein